MTQPESQFQIPVSRFDRFLMNVAPRYGRERFMNKAAMFGGTSAGFLTPGSPARATLQGWKVSGNGANVDSLPKLDKLRQGSRDLWMNTPLAVGALRRIQTNVIGQGLSLQSTVDYKLVGLTEEQAEEWSRDVERKWKYWSRKEADIRRSHTFEELQSLALLSQMLSGDVFALLPHLPRKGAVFNLRVQLIEADYISNPLGKNDTEQCAGGVEVDDNGAPVTYYMRTPLNGQRTMMLDDTNRLGKWIPIPAFGEKSGRRNMLHLYDIDRPGQRRGLPLLAPLLLPLKNIGRLSDSEVTGALVASMFTVFIKNVPKGTMAPMFGAQQSVLNNDPYKDNKYELAPGAIVGLQQGQEIEIAKPDRPSGMFVPAFETFVREFAMALQVPYEVLMLHYGQSYSASKAALLEAWKFFSTKRGVFAVKFNQEIFEAWLADGISSGIIKAPGFFEDPMKRDAWSRAHWNGPGVGQINPLDETKASLLLMKAGLSSHETEHTKIYGTDWEGTARQLSRERKLKEQLGIPEVQLNGMEDKEEPKTPEGGNAGG